MLLLLTVAFVSSCEKPVTLKDIKKKGEIVILTRNAATTHYENKRGEFEGFEHDLAESFAKYLGVEAKFKVLDSVKSILDALESNEGHFAAAGLSKTKKRKEKFIFGPVYQSIKQQVVCNKDASVKDIESLQDHSILIIGNSSYEERLTKYANKYRGLEWETTSNLSTEEILKEVEEGNVDCTLSDSNIFKIHRRYFPELVRAFEFEEEDELAWMLPKKIGPLQKQMANWHEKIEKSGALNSIIERYYGHISKFDYYDIKVFYRRIDERLPDYADLFKEAARKYGFAWKFLAAISYQESHWDPKAKSPTGVRGMMMLTQSTAKAMGVNDRMDPKQSIDGGAKYLKKVLDRIPAYIEEPDRTWMAMASYNVGYSHLRDARALAVWKEKNPNLWVDVKSVLPLLSKKKYYRKLPHGYARGLEPVIYVKRARSYYNILKEMEEPEVETSTTEKETKGDEG